MDNNDDGSQMQPPMDQLPMGDNADGGEDQVDQYFDDGGEVFLPADHVSTNHTNLYARARPKFNWFEWL